MIRDNYDLKNSSLQDASPAQAAESGCRAHWKLNEWQVRQYRRAIDENKWYMGERLGRVVSWEEAEYDFLHNGYYGCAPKWRKEYCSMRCHHFSSCTLGQRFVKQ
jgi:hypothetical protein